MAKQNINEEVRKEAAQVAVSKAEQFYTSNKKVIWGVVIAVIVIGAAVLGYTKYVYQPKCEEAQAQMYPAEQLFAAGQYETALNGDGNILGFAQVIEDYGAKAGKAVYFYAGVCALETGNNEDALNYLKKYKSDDPVLGPRAKACQGDALVNLGEEHYAEAAQCFVQAAGMADNMFAAGYLVKAGIAYEALGDNAKALECYQNVKDNYPQSIEGMEIDKYIARIAE